MALTESTLVNNLYVHGDFYLYYDYLSQKAQLHFLFRKPGDVAKEGESYFLPILVTTIRIIVLLPSLLLVPFLDVFLLLLPFSIWRMMCAFQRYCTMSMGGPMSTEKVFIYMQMLCKFFADKYSGSIILQILRKYWMIKSLLKDINGAIGLMLCCCVSVSLPYYATFFAVTYFNESVHFITLLHVYGFFIVFFLALTLAADINKKVRN